MAHEPCGVIPDGQLTADHEGRNAPFVMANEICGHELLTQIGAGLMKHGVSGNRVLMTAFGALKKTGAETPDGMPWSIGTCRK